MSITIASVDANFEREPLRYSFGFKGGYMSEIWQSIALLSNDRQRAIGLNTQSVRGRTRTSSSTTPEAAGNSLMFAMTEYALRQAKGMTFDTPFDLLDRLLPATWEYGKAITRNPDLRMTFALNALVGVDAAAWLLYARENDFTSFDDMIPAEYQPLLSHRHSLVGCIP